MSEKPPQVIYSSSAAEDLNKKQRNERGVEKDPERTRIYENPLEDPVIESFNNEHYYSSDDEVEVQLDALVKAYPEKAAAYESQIEQIEDSVAVAREKSASITHQDSEIVRSVTPESVQVPTSGPSRPPESINEENLQKEEVRMRLNDLKRSDVTHIGAHTMPRRKAKAESEGVAMTEESQQRSEVTPGSGGVEKVAETKEENEGKEGSKKEESHESEEKMGTGHKAEKKEGGAGHAPKEKHEKKKWKDMSVRQKALTAGGAGLATAAGLGAAYAGGALVSSGLMNAVGYGAMINPAAGAAAWLSPQAVIGGGFFDILAISFAVYTFKNWRTLVDDFNPVGQGFGLGKGGGGGGKKSGGGGGHAPAGGGGHAPAGGGAHH